MHNGWRPKTVLTPEGDVEVKTSRLRRGSFFPEAFESRRRVDRALMGDHDRRRDQHIDLEG